MKIITADYKILYLKYKQIFKTEFHFVNFLHNLFEIQKRKRLSIGLN